VVLALASAGFVGLAALSFGSEHSYGFVTLDEIRTFRIRSKHTWVVFVFAALDTSTASAFLTSSAHCFMLVSALKWRSRLIFSIWPGCWPDRRCLDVVSGTVRVGLS
jgi:hypothetical protein